MRAGMNMNEARTLMLNEKGLKKPAEVRAIKDPVARAFQAAFMDTGKGLNVLAGRACLRRAAELALLEGDTETARTVLGRDMRRDGEDMMRPYARAIKQLAKTGDTENLMKVLDAMPRDVISLCNFAMSA